MACKRTTSLTAALGAVFLIAAGSNAPAAQESRATEVDDVREAIWAKERAIYAARGDGDLGVYVNNASEHYRGWPPGWAKPSGLDKLRSAIPLMRDANQEELSMVYGDIAVSGDTAVIYYNTHRTRTPTGQAVDERFEIIHVWTREGDDWKLLGAMGRNKQEPGQ